MLKILGKATSINVRKVLWTCAELDLPYELEEWGSGHRDPAVAEFQALNPNALVPVIQDGDFVLWESNSIIRYLAASREATDLLPNDPGSRAAIEQWMDWQATEFNNAWRYAFSALVRQDPAFDNKSKIEASVANWTAKIEILENQLQTTGAYVTGPDFTLADIPIGLSVNRWYMTPLDHPDFPRVRCYYDRLTERPGFQIHGRNGVA